MQSVKPAQCLTGVVGLVGERTCWAELHDDFAKVPNRLSLSLLVKAASTTLVASVSTTIEGLIHGLRPCRSSVNEESAMHYDACARHGPGEEEA